MKTQNSKSISDILLDIASDVCEGAKILDNFIIHRKTRIELSLENKNNPQKPLVNWDRTSKSDHSLLQIILMLIGAGAAVAAFLCMAKIRKCEKKKMKDKLKKAKAECNEKSKAKKA